MNASMLSEKIIGKTLKEVERICKKNSVKCRISDEDGKPIMGTCDFKPDRLNLSVNKGIVTGSHLG